VRGHGFSTDWSAGFRSEFFNGLVRIAHADSSSFGRV
jgi:hypothetical protein